MYRARSDEYGSFDKFYGTKEKHKYFCSTMLHRCIYRVPIVRRRYLFLTGSPQLFSQPIQEQVIRTCTFPSTPFPSRYTTNVYNASLCNFDIVKRGMKLQPDLRTYYTLRISLIYLIIFQKE